MIKIYAVTMWAYTKDGVDSEEIGYFETKVKAEDFIEWIDDTLEHFSSLNKTNMLLCEYAGLFEQFIADIQEKGWKNSSVRRILRRDCDNWVAMKIIEVK